MAPSPPRRPSRVRRPSEASSIRSGRGGPTMNNGYGNGVPPSPGLPMGEYGRPMPKQFQSNTIVPNKSTMVEEDDDAVGPTSPAPGFGMNGMSWQRPGNERGWKWWREPPSPSEVRNQPHHPAITFADLTRSRPTRSSWTSMQPMLGASGKLDDMEG